MRFRVIHSILAQFPPFCFLKHRMACCCLFQHHAVPLPPLHCCYVDCCHSYRLSPTLFARRPAALVAAFPPQSGQSLFGILDRKTACVAIGCCADHERHTADRGTVRPECRQEQRNCEGTNKGQLMQMKENSFLGDRFWPTINKPLPHCLPLKYVPPPLTLLSDIQSGTRAPHFAYRHSGIGRRRMALNRLSRGG